ncbi:hypothetical protein B7463_g5428, partial [Scytalidium lignicola]
MLNYCVLLLWASQAVLALPAQSTVSTTLPKVELLGSMSQPGGFSVPLTRNATANTTGTALRARANGRADVYTSGVRRWWITLSVGTPPQPLNILADSGDDGFFLQSTLLPASLQGNDPLYNPDASSTSHLLEGYTWTGFVGYGSSGVIYTDVVTIGDASWSGIPVEAMTSLTSVQENSLTGNVGVSYATVVGASPNNVPCFLPSIRPSLSSGVFTVTFDFATTSGTMDFGFIDPTKYTGDIQYAPVNPEEDTFWNITFGGFYASNTYWIYPFVAIIDTGTFGSSLPSLAMQYYFAQVEGAELNTDHNTYSFPCSQSASLPDFIFTLGPDFHGIIPSETFANGGSIDGGTTCITNLGIVSDGGTPLIGEVLLEGVFTIFDWDNSQVGFANKPATPTAPEAVPSVTPTPSPASAGSSFVCTGADFTGTCQDERWAEASCQDLSQTPYTYHLGSLGPDDGACTVYNDAACTEPISGLEGITNPGNSALPADNIGSYLCINPSLTTVGSGTLDLPTPVKYFQKQNWGCGHGSCWVYSDTSCVHSVSGTASITNPGLADANYSTAGSFMCV